MRSIEINKHFWSLEATNFLAIFIFELKAKYQFGVNENNVIFILPIGVHEPLRGPRTPGCERLF